MQMYNRMYAVRRLAIILLQLHIPVLLTLVHQDCSVTEAIVNVEFTLTISSAAMVVAQWYCAPFVLLTTDTKI